ncbi:hypothetical protein QYF61_003247 [Mycteria americana]|uniref:Uncharacterized protein n=2 Tax=Neoaves TaxID=3078114 RepID=A0AAN7PN53_MYCAM|nr:hypothetical protein QYF61_003247 [Mycteria americana]
MYTVTLGPSPTPRASMPGTQLLACSLSLLQLRRHQGPKAGRLLQASAFFVHLCAVVDDGSPLASAERERKEGRGPPLPRGRLGRRCLAAGLITIKEAHDIEARLNEVEKLLKTIINMPWKYSRSEVVLTFFERSPLDQVLKNDNVHKIQPSFQSPVKISEIMRSNGFCLANTETIVIDHSIPNGKEKHLDVDTAEHFPAGHTISDTSQDAIGLLGHRGTLLAHIQPAIDQHSQVLFCLAAFQPLFPKPVAMHGVMVTQVQDLTLSLVEPHTIDLGPSIQPVQVPLQSLPPLKQINTPTQPGVICKLTEGALDPLIQAIDKDIKQN